MRTDVHNSRTVRLLVLQGSVNRKRLATCNINTPQNKDHFLFVLKWKIKCFLATSLSLRPVFLARYTAMRIRSDRRYRTVNSQATKITDFLCICNVFHIFLQTNASGVRRGILESNAYWSKPYSIHYETKHSGHVVSCDWNRMGPPSLQKTTAASVSLLMSAMCWKANNSNK
jgi:hypothetical protein